MTPQQQLAFIKSKCIEANTEKQKSIISANETGHTVKYIFDLPDVLLAIEKTDNEIFFNYNHNGFCIRYNDYRTKNGANKSATWNLLLPLDGQSKEVWAFLCKLLENEE